MNNNLQSYIEPFTSFEDFFKALIIVIKIHSKNKDNSDHIHECIKAFISQPIRKIHIDNFVQRVLTYSNQYPIQLIASYDTFISSLHSYLINGSYESVTIESPAEHCVFCPVSSANWDNFKNTPYQKLAILYTENRIGWFKLFLIISF